MSIIAHVEGNGTAETAEAPNTVPERGKPQISPPHRMSRKNTNRRWNFQRSH
jgi:hypothetical protein